jgi:outer membrane lipoprotein SlyB
LSTAPKLNQAAAKAEQQKEKTVAKAPVSTVKRAPVVVARSPRASICATCGTVESVVAVQRQGQVNGVAVGGTTVGIGTVAGGVVGGLLGNQVGGGNGKTAMTVLGVAGGAYAGNTIEKNMKKVTVYQMRVRMNDGSLRTIEQASAVPSGSRVIVEGHTLRLAPTASSSAATYLSYSAAMA